MKVYTKKGDLGKTSLYGGTEVLKNDKQIEAYGTVDELNSFLGLLSDKVLSVIPNFSQNTFLRTTQNHLFVVGSHLAYDKSKSQLKMPNFSVKLIEQIEKEIDEMDSKLEPMTHFILPGGHELISLAHVLRTVCRRAERNVVTLAENTSDYNVIVQYLNRLSDYFFVLSRYLAVQLKVEEIKWIS